MAALRVGDRALGQGAAQLSIRQSRLTHFSAAIASPLGIMTLLPLLVAAIGLVLTLVGQRALRESNLALANDRINEETMLAARNLSLALEQSGPILDRLGALARAHDPSQPYVAVAHSLQDLMQGRPGVSYVSISFPDGTFQGVYRDEQDGVIRFQDSRVTPKGTVVKRFSLVGHERLEPYFVETSDYDPRSRPFYQLALATPRRVWTKPYPFFKTHYTGITRTEAIYLTNAAGQPELHAVITVDFDVEALSRILRRISLGGAISLLYANDGTLLAYPRGAAAIANLPLRKDRALLYSDLSDPLLNAFFAQGGSAANAGSSDAAPVTRLDANGEQLLVSRRSIANDPDLPWSVATLIPEAQVLSALHEHQRQSLIAAAVATLFASALAWLFARHILRARHEIAEARAEARAAVAQAQELGSYRLIERLGKGGMGEVWRAEHRLLVRQAAIKLISLDGEAALDLQEVQERFRREAQSLATLRSRNTIELFDYGVTQEGTFFYVMELLDGMDLETLVRTHGAQPAARVIDFLIQACNSLAEAHDAGLVHRDIKPANLYVCRIADEVDVLKVLDFGLVRSAVRGSNQLPTVPPSANTLPISGVHQAVAVHAMASVVQEARITQVGRAMGTPAYMAPEQALGYETDGRADLYALACVGFWLLSGRLLFQQSGSLPMMMAHISEAPPAFDACISGYLPPELSLVLMRCLSKQAHERPRNAHELSAALKAIPIVPSEQWTEIRAQAWWDTEAPKPAAAQSQPLPEVGVA